MIFSQYYQKPKILLTGTTGQVGSKLLSNLQKNSDVWAPQRKDFNLKNPESLREKIREFQPDLIINPAAYTLVNEAEANEYECFQVNQNSPKVLAEEAELRKIPIIHFSTDYVFDGKKQGPYLETDNTNPINVYGLSKLGAERAIQNITEKHLIIRTAWVYDKDYGTNFYRKIKNLIQTQKEIYVVNDEIGNPTSASFLAKTICSIVSQLDILNNAENRWGLYHLVEDLAMSRYQFAQKIFSEINSYNNNINCKIHSASLNAVQQKIKRPQNSVLSTKKINTFFSLNG